MKKSTFGQATVRLTDKNTGRVEREITAHNTVNQDYAAEIRANIFNPTASLTLLLSDYDQPSPQNGLIFPMGHFLGRGKYNTGASGMYLGSYSSANSVLNTQLANGCISDTFSWDFAASQLTPGTLRSLFLFWDAAVTRYPGVVPPILPWKGNPRWSFENKLFDIAAKTVTQYYICDYYTKEAVLHDKSNTLTVSGVARDVDSKHVFIFDSAVKKLYEFESIDTDMVMSNVLAEYPCTKAFFGKGLIKGNNLFYISTFTDPAYTNAAMGGAAVYLYRYDFTTDSSPALIDTMTCAELGITTFYANDPCAFIDDYLLYYYMANTVTYSPVLRVVGNTARMGITGIYGNASAHTIQRISPTKQMLISGPVTGPVINVVPGMAISHLPLPEPVVKDAQHSLSVSYTISNQD